MPIIVLLLAVFVVLLVGRAASKHEDKAMEQQFLSQWDKSVKPPRTLDPAIIAKILVGAVILLAIAIAIGVALGI